VTSVAAAAGLGERVDGAIALATDRLLVQQRPHGFWQGRVESAASLEAEYLLLLRLLGRRRPETEAPIVERLRALQRDDGGWALAPDLPSHLSTTVEGYFALLLAGARPDEPSMVRAREWILAQGGLARVGTFTRFWLAAFGQFPASGVPSVPMELVLVPAWAPVSLAAFASWLRAPLVALGLLAAEPVTARVPPEAQLADLWIAPPRPEELTLPPAPRVAGRQRLFYALDRVLGVLGRSRWKPQRRRAVARAIEWLLRHQEPAGTWAGLAPVTMPVLAALNAIGFGLDHPAMQRGLQGLDDLLLHDDGALSCQPTTSPVWDTAQALRALRAAGIAPAHPAVARAADWLCAQQVFRVGDWTARAPGLDPGGWPLSPGNEHYPRIDVTAAVVLAVAGVDAGDVRRALAFGRQWVAGMQGGDGGWAAFDRGAPPRALDTLPFPDFEGQTDPTCPDMTAAALEVLGDEGFDARLGRVRRAIVYLERTQRRDGSWLGRWHVATLAGTAGVLVGLAAAGVDPATASVRRALDWLAGRQNADGGFGETPLAYEPGADGRGASTPSQTARVLLGLVAAGEAAGPAATRAAAWLVAAQDAAGGWRERAFTATGVPRRGYLRHALDAEHLPLRALARWRAAVRPGRA